MVSCSERSSDFSIDFIHVPTGRGVLAHENMMIVMEASPNRFKQTKQFKYPKLRKYVDTESSHIQSMESKHLKFKK